MEIGDIFVVNKCDKEGADKTVVELNMMLDLDEKRLETTGSKSSCARK